MRVREAGARDGGAQRGATDKAVDMRASRAVLAGWAQLPGLAMLRAR
jgi:hypothetical protein